MVAGVKNHTNGCLHSLTALLKATTPDTNLSNEVVSCQPNITQACNLRQLIQLTHSIPLMQASMAAPENARNTKVISNYATSSIASYAATEKPRNPAIDI